MKQYRIVLEVLNYKDLAQSIYLILRKISKKDLAQRNSSKTLKELRIDNATLFLMIIALETEFDITIEDKLLPDDVFSNSKDFSSKFKLIDLVNIVYQKLSDNDTKKKHLKDKIKKGIRSLIDNDLIVKTTLEKLRDIKTRILYSLSLGLRQAAVRTLKR